MANGRKKINNNKLHFKSIGADVLYFPTVYKQGRHEVIAPPFILMNGGNIKNINTGKGKNKLMIIKRKYPLFGNILNYANLLYGGKIQGANTRDFSDAEDIYVIDFTPLTMHEAAINGSNKYRFLRYLPNDTTYGDIAELAFYYKDKKGNEAKAQGEMVYRYDGKLSRSASSAFDGNINSYYRSDIKNTWIGIDLGQGNEKAIVKVKFCPRTDANFIIPGQKYELFFWDKSGWEPLGKKTAVKYELEYLNTPKKALFWLHCLSGGVEERPFTYEYGKQVWW